MHDGSDRRTILGLMASSISTLPEGRNFGEAFSSSKRDETREHSSSFVINPIDYGAKFDGVSDDTHAIDSAIRALVKIKGSFTPAASYVLQFPPGRAITRGGHVIPPDIKVRVVGSGAYSTTLFLAKGANNFVLDIQGIYSSVEKLNIDGNRYNNLSNVECLRINAAFVLIDRVFVSNASGDGIAIGLNATAINSRMRNCDIRNCRGYGLVVYKKYSSTDCHFSDVSIGKSGKSGFFLGSSGQKLSGCHSWGNGLFSSLDNHGYNIKSSGHVIIGCIGETNIGSGVYIDNNSLHIMITGGSFWGNSKNGINAFRSSYCGISSVSIRNNGSMNHDGTESVHFANIFLDECSSFVVNACIVVDDGHAIAAGEYSDSPDYMFLGRPSVRTVSMHYAESKGSQRHSITSNIMPSEQTITGKSATDVGGESIMANNIF